MHVSPETLKTAAVEKLAELKDAELKPKDRMAIPPQEMPSQDPMERCKNMSEVALGYYAEQARLESMRCLQCKNAPCISGCPVAIRIPDFLKAAAEGRFDDAVGIIRENSLLPAVCGRVCPQETQCQLPCTVGKVLKDVNKSVSIGRVERYVADLQREHGKQRVPPVKAETGKKVAVIGSAFDILPDFDEGHFDMPQQSAC